MPMTALYRHFDEDGELLYVGVSLCAVDRLSQHQREAPWFQFIARIEVQWFSSRSAALNAEVLAIRTEGPIFNRMHAKPGDPVRAERMSRVHHRADAAVAALSRKCDMLGEWVNYAGERHITSSPWAGNRHLSADGDEAQGAGHAGALSRGSAGVAR